MNTGIGMVRLGGRSFTVSSMTADKQAFRCEGTHAEVRMMKSFVLPGDKTQQD